MTNNYSENKNDEIKQLTLSEIKYSELHKAGGGIVEVPQDTRDYVFGSTHPDNITTDFEWVLDRLPTSADLRINAVHIHNQYGNSCVGQSVAWAAELLLKQRNKHIELSPMFIYYNSRKRTADIYGIPVQDSGTNVLTALGMSTIKGMAEESFWPYYMDHSTPPSESANTNALKHKVTRYEACGLETVKVTRNRIADIKVALASGIPVSFCINLHRDFYSVKGNMISHNTQYPFSSISSTNPNFVGAHCMTFVGYDDSKQMFIVANSWGESWGDNGYWGMSYNKVNSGLFGIYAIRGINDEYYEVPNKYKSNYPAVDSTYGKVYRLYQAAFNRKPDVAGLDYWIGRYSSMTLREIAQQFVLSAEWISLYGESLTPESFVTLLYINVLKRTPDSDGLSYWVSRLNADATRVELLVQFSESEENKTAVQW